MDLLTRKRINVSIAFLIIWLFCIGVFFVFYNIIKPTLFNTCLVLIFESILCFVMWIFFMLKIEWLKDMNTGKEINHLNISNILSALRFSLIPMLIALFGLITGDGKSLYLKIIIFIFMVLVCLTDLFDGILARKLNEVTKLGMVLDPFGDFMIITCFAVLIFTKGAIEWWYFILVMIRIPFLIIVMLGLMAFNIKYKLKTSFLGRLTIFYTLGFLGVATVSLFFEKPFPEWFTIFLMVAQIVGALIIILSSAQKIKLLVYYLKNQKTLEDENIQF
jgi:cardiolipin synthase (CMP-forming)